MVAFFEKYGKSIGGFVAFALLVGAFFFGGYYRFKCYYPFCKEQRLREDLTFKSTLLVFKGTELLRDEEGSRYGDLDVHLETVYYANPRGKIYALSQENRVIFEPIFDISSQLDLDDSAADERFGSVRGLEVAGKKGEELFFLSVLLREHDRDCYRVAVLKRQRRDDNWQRIYGTPECISQEQMVEGSGRFIMAGGKLEKYGANQLLLTVGNFHYEPAHPAFEESQGRDASFLDQAGHHLGKIIIMDSDGGGVRIFAAGVRNPQGLVVTDDGLVYETEHGTDGGDEINFIEEGKHYGYPYRAYGIPYGGAHAWPPNRRYKKSDYQEPLLAFGVSQGISDITQVRMPSVDGWEDVLLVSAMAQYKLYRIGVERERVVLIEPIVTDNRARALEFHEGKLYMIVDGFVYRFDIDYRYDEFE